MKPLLIAATTLALTGAAFAQTATEDAAKAAGEAAQATKDAAQAAGEAANEAAEAAGEAAQAAGEAAEAAVTPEAPADTMTAPAPVETVVAPDVAAPAISEANPGLTSSWLTSRRIYTTNQPSSTEWSDPALTERPAEWTDIAKVNDVVMDADGNLIGYIADIGGFLGMGAKSVLLGKDALHLVHLENDAFFATNYTKEELEALPDFDTNSVMK